MRAIDLISPVDWQQPLNRGLNTWWMKLPGMGRGDIFVDITKGGNDAKLHTAGVLNTQGYWFSDSYAPTWSTARLNTPSNQEFFQSQNNTAANGWAALSLSAWVKVTNYQAAAGLVAVRNSTGNILGLTLNSIANQDVVMWVADATTNKWVLSPTNAITTNTWQHIVGTWTKNQLAKLYVDGTLQAVTDNGILTTNLQQDDFVKIGQDDDTPATRVLIGNIGDVRLWNRSLSSAEVEAVYLDSLDGYQSTLHRLSQTPIYQAGVTDSGQMIMSQGKFLRPLTSI